MGNHFARSHSFIGSDQFQLQFHRVVRMFVEIRFDRSHCRWRNGEHGHMELGRVHDNEQEILMRWVDPVTLLDHNSSALRQGLPSIADYRPRRLQ